MFTYAFSEIKMTHRRLWLLLATLFILGPQPTPAQSTQDKEGLEQLMADFVRGWREGNVELLSKVVEMEEGRITWVSGDGADERVGSMTFRSAVERNRSHPEYGLDGWELQALDIVDGQLAMAKLKIPEGDHINIDYMVCYRVAGERRIVSNTFVILNN
jgi:hypothetical protein